jgi:hypothetical protein
LSELPYYRIPEPPLEINAATLLIRLVDGLGFRYRWATEGLRKQDYIYQPSIDSMTVKELLKHILRLVNRSYECLGGDTEIILDSYELDEVRSITLKKLTMMRELIESIEDKKLASCTISSRGVEYPFWNLINGPLSDALTHVGQMNSWRRLNGNPVPKVNVFTGNP